MPLKPKTSRARRLRRDATEAERILWRALREADPPIKCHRQHPIANYVADFAIPSRNRVIELDGGQHADAVAKDACRTEALQARDYRVIRFWNNEILENLDGVLTTILREIDNPPPHPNPLRPQGQRGKSTGSEESPLRWRGGEG